MSALTHSLMTAALLADPDAAEAEPSLMIPGLLLGSFMLLAIMGVWAAIYFAMRWRKAAAEPAAAKRSVLDRLAAAHGISADDVQRLRSLMTGKAATDPGMVFIDPRWLEACVAERPADAAWAASMGERLFGAAFLMPAVQDPAGVA